LGNGLRWDTLTKIIAADEQKEDVGWSWVVEPKPAIITWRPIIPIKVIRNLVDPVAGMALVVRLPGLCESGRGIGRLRSDGRKRVTCIMQI
jgi:hypothetical protein